MGSCPGSRSGSIAFSPRDEFFSKTKGVDCSPRIQRVNREDSPDLVCTGEPESEYGSVREGGGTQQYREQELEEEKKNFSPKLKDNNEDSSKGRKKWGTTAVGGVNSARPYGALSPTKSHTSSSDRVKKTSKFLLLRNVAQAPPLEADIFVMSGFCDQALCTVERYSISRDEWEPAGVMSVPRTKFCAVQLSKDRFLVVGGKQADGTRIDHCELFERDKGFRKEKGIVLTKGRSGFGCVVHDGAVYVIGGNDGRVLNKVEKWNGAEKKWEKVGRMSVKRDELAAVVGSDGRIYAVGGYGGVERTCLTSCERYDPESHSWEEIAPMKEGRRALALVAHGRFVYALGGYNGKSYMKSVERFDIETGRWESVRDMNRGRCTLAAAVHGDKIYVLGGFDGEPLREVEVYDIVKDEWRVCRSMGEKRFMHAAVVMTV